VPEYRLKICPLCLAFAVLVAVTPNNAIAESADDYTIAVRAAYSAFECSVLARKSKQVDEQKRLFRHGYEEGTKFVAALRAGKIQREGLRQDSDDLLTRLEGPNADFILGRLFEYARESALANVEKSGRVINPDAEQLQLARMKFKKQNCALIGN